MTNLPPAALATDRRGLLKAGMLGLAGIALPLSAAEGPKGFTHGVASGEPGETQVLLWTRYVGGTDTKLGYELSETLDFARIVTSGDALASPERDWCAKAVATGLAPGKWYYYRFIAPSGERSATGRTRTMPVGKLASFKLAVFSCSNLGFGYFNAYAHAAEAGEFDLAVHLGDYYYEYKRGKYPSAKEALEGRLLWPDHEVVLLADYRERHANYRSDPDLQRLHQLLPWVVMWDDHESANDSYKDGAENHQPDTEGDWGARKAASERAYREWLPVSDDDWASYEIGDLATLYRLESRLVARTRQLDLLGAAGSGDAAMTDAALKAFRDGAWRDSSRTLLGQTQEAWLADTLRRSARAGKPWQVIGQQIVMGSLAMPDLVAEAIPATAPESFKARIRTTVSAAHQGIPYSMDSWDGYPAARERLLQSALAADANLLVLSGDSHNAWAFDLATGNHRVGVEMGAQSVTSPGAEDSLPWIKPADLERALAARNPALKWADTSRRGYLSVELTPASATGEWRFMSTVRQKGTALSGTRRMTVLAGQRRYET